MNRKKLAGLALGLGAAMVFGGCSPQGKNGKANQKVLRIGVSSYDQYDTFVSELISRFQNYAKEKEKEWGITINLDIRYAQRSQLAQNGQMDDFIDDQVDIACINLVDRTDASGIIEKAKKSQTPVIFFNRELVEEDLDRWDGLYYVGADAYESGRLQGKILVEECQKNFDKIDKNKDGVLQYVMLEGEAGHNDSLARSMAVIEEITESGYTVEKLADEIANWNRDQAATKMQSFLDTYGDEIEVILANNDDMALGAVDVLTEAGLKPGDADWPVILGIDGTSVGLEAVKNGELLGTVLHDGEGQAHAMLELAYALATQNELPEEYQLKDGKYIRLPYRGITAENLP